MFKPMPHFVAYLERSMPAKSTWLPISAQKMDALTAHLANNDWFHVVISDGKTSEVAKIIKICGKIAVLRGEQHTTAKDFICWAKLSFVLTPKDIEDFVCHMQDSDCEGHMNNYKAILDWSAVLFGKLDDVSQKLPVSIDAEAALLSKLADEDYTYLRISTADEVEIVKATNVGGVLVLERGVSGSSASVFPRGSCVTGIITAEAIRAIVCSMDCCP